MRNRMGAQLDETSLASRKLDLALLSYTTKYHQWEDHKNSKISWHYETWLTNQYRGGYLFHIAEEAELIAAAAHITYKAQARILNQMKGLRNGL